MTEITRRDLLLSGGRVVAGVGTGAMMGGALAPRVMADGDTPDENGEVAKRTLKVPTEVEWAGAWLSWVAATTSCLRALGLKCDRSEVAGVSGYAFHLCVAADVGPAGPTILDWGALCGGVNFLGRSTSYFGSHETAWGDLNDRTRAQCRAAFELARREIEAGRPCVMWGAYAPEFAAVVGVENDAYVVKSFREVLGQEQPPVPFDEVQAPGGPYVLAFPTATELPRVAADQYAVFNAVRMFNTPATSPYRYGAAAYDLWMESLRAGKADAFGNSYCAACFAEGREFAAIFLTRLALRNEFAAAPLGRAGDAYTQAADAMKRVTKLFPFPGKTGKKVSDADSIAQAVEALSAAKDAESRAIQLLTRVTEMDWPNGEAA